MTWGITRADKLFLPGVVRPHITHESFFPSALREFQVELAGRLALSDAAGDEVRRWRERYGFTQSALAPLLELRRESLSRIESGRVALTLPVLVRFTRLITLARGVREHLAFVEARGNVPDGRHLDMLGMVLRLSKATADDVVLEATMQYDKKKRQALRGVPSTRV